jgi:hypothetical protein
MDTFTARTPTDLLALVPIVIGFHPEDSAVLLTFGSRGTDVATGPESFQARVDLPVTEHEQRAVAAMLRDVVAQHRIQLVALLVYSQDAAAAESFADLLVPALLADDVEVVDVLRADGERYFRVETPDSVGTPYELGSHPLTATGVLQGRVVHESRQALQDTLVGTDPDRVQDVDVAADAFLDTLLSSGPPTGNLTAAFEAEGLWLLDFLADRVAAREQLSVADTGRVLVLLSFDSLREVAWTELRRSNAPDYIDLLRGLIRDSPRELQAGVGGLLGLAAWLAGDGALAWCALDTCFAADPDDQLAHNVAALLESATPPSVWAPLPASSLPVLGFVPPVARSQ